MKVILTGSNGQLGRELVSTKPSQIELIPTTRKELNLGDENTCKNFIIQNKPDWIINAGAYTNVDKAEEETKIALSVNSKAPKIFAEVLKNQGGNLLQISTDFVFGGHQNFPYKTDVSKSPLSIYGLSKSIAEDKVVEILSESDQVLILRTSWIMSTYGKNFAMKMLELHKNKKKIKVVFDQVGCPTSANKLAILCWKILAEKAFIKRLKSLNMPPIIHWCDDGVASWYDVSYEVGEMAKEFGLIDKAAKIIPILSKDYPTLAKRPKYSLLDNNLVKNLMKLEGEHWKSTLRSSFKRLVIDDSKLNI